MTAAEAITTDVGVKPACDALGVSRATLYRRRKPKVERARTPSPRALSDLERQSILDVLCDERFQDASPAQVYATLLDEGVRLASVSTMYRILAASQAVRERRAIARPAISIERLALTCQGNVRYTLTTPYRDGTTHIILEPLDFIARLAALIPKPRVNLTRFGVFAPNSRLRSQVTLAGRGKRMSNEAKTPAQRHAAMSLKLNASNGYSRSISKPVNSAAVPSK